MERKLKERLVGASLLVVAGVIVIPWLLDGRVAPPEKTESLTLPRAGSAASTTRKIVLDAGTPQSAAPTPPAAAPRDVAPPDPLPATSAPRGDAPPVVQALDSDPPRTRPAAPPDTSDPAAGWAVQVGSFSSQSNADKLARRLTDLGYKAFVSRKVIDDRVMYRVRVGPQRSRDDAEAIARRLRAEDQPVRIVEHPG